MERLPLQGLARAKIEDAKLLLDHGRAGNAYYLAGYAVEIGLKACIARQFRADVIPDRRLVASVYDHDLERLAGVAGLAIALKKRRLEDDRFDIYWGLASKWRPEARYSSAHADEASLIVQAVDDPDHGILRWIAAYW